MEEPIGRARQVEYYGDLAVGDGEIDGERDAAAELEQLRLAATGQLRRRARERGYGRGGPDGTAIVEEGHRDEVMAKEKAAHPNQREETAEITGGVGGRKVNALVAEGILDHLAPAPAMKRGPALLAPAELVPGRSGTLERGDSDRRARPGKPGLGLLG